MSLASCRIVSGEQAQTQLIANKRQDVELPEAQIPLIVRLMNVFAQYYHCPEMFETWSANSVFRESLGSVAGNGAALLHQFQRNRDCPVRLRNQTVDWWLVLIPGGADWNSLDEQPVHWIIVPVLAQPVGGFAMRAWALADPICGSLCRTLIPDPVSWGKRLSQMDRITAARTINVQFARAIASVQWS